MINVIMIEALGGTSILSLRPRMSEVEIHLPAQLLPMHCLYCKVLCISILNSLTVTIVSEF